MTGLVGRQDPLDGIDFTFFDEIGPMVTAYQGDQIDAIVQFDVNSGAVLFTDPTSTSSKALTTNHRQIWMRVDKGQFADKRVRQALALHAWIATAMIQQLFKGQGQVAQRPRDLLALPVLRSSTPQRTRDIEQAKHCCLTPGRRTSRPTLHFGRATGDPRSRGAASRANAKDAGITLNPAGESLEHLLQRPVVPGRSRRIRRAPVRRSSASSTTATVRRRTCPQLRTSDQGRLELAAIRRHRSSMPRSASSSRPSASMPRRSPAARSRPSSTTTFPSSSRTIYVPRPATPSKFDGVYLERPRADVSSRGLEGLIARCTEGDG